MPEIVVLNDDLANEMGLTFSHLSKDHLGKIFTAQKLPDGAEPIAQAYAGHQFGGFTFLGDGRALLLGEHLKPSGQRVDIHLKGAGQTAFSRRGDGRAVIGPMLREFLISEAMHHLGIPTTRSLAVATTGEAIYRDRALPGAVLTRIASSHIRVGTFEFAAARKNLSDLKFLADYTLQRHFIEHIGHVDCYLKLLESVIERQASLIARWQSVGFIHGVMNTDNMAISGETIDYGPCAFMDTYHPETVFSSIDRNGRYAYGNQPAIAQWNLARFAESLLALIDPNPNEAVQKATDLIQTFPVIFELKWLDIMRRKLGLTLVQTDDEQLIKSLLEVMRTLQLDFTNTFRDLGNQEALKNSEYDKPEFRAWVQQWEKRLQIESQTPMSVSNQMNRQNPCYIARNHKVEAALLSAETENNLEPFNKLLLALRKPYDEHPDFEEFRIPASKNDQNRYRTYCGT